MLASLVNLSFPSTIPKRYTSWKQLIVRRKKVLIRTENAYFTRSVMLVVLVRLLAFKGAYILEASMGVFS